MEKNGLDLKTDGNESIFSILSMQWVVQSLWDAAGFYILVFNIVWGAAVNYIISASPELCLLASWCALFLKRNLFEF